MDASDLRVFEAVARLGGMNRAAAELHTVQSNVSTRIRLLEEELGTPLFNRHSRGVTLAPAGQRLLPHAVKVAHLIEDARRAVRDDGLPKGPLTIGSLETTAALRLPPILANYVAAYPEVDLTLTTGTTSELVERVLEHRLEGAFVCGPVSHPELIEEAMFPEELVVVTDRSVRTLDELVRKSDLKVVVLRLGCSYRQRLEAILAKRGVVGLRLLEFGTIDAIIGCVVAGIGLTLLPRVVVASALRQGRVAVHALPQEEAWVETLFIRRRDGFLSTSLTIFLQEARRAPAPAAGE